MARSNQSVEASSRSRADKQTASSRRDEEFLAERRRREAANLKKTLELRAQRLAHQALNPPKPKVRRRAAAKPAAAA
jgi:hypothetical protein